MTIRSVYPAKSLRAAVLTLFALAATAAFAIAPQARITAPIDSSSRATLANSRPLRANPANDIGAVSPSMQLQGMSIVLSRSAAQQTALNTLLAAQQNPASPLYHRWLTPAQFGAQFGAADADIAAIEAWLEQQGFTVDSVSNSRNRIFFSGTAAQVASAFQAPLHYYRTPATAAQPAVTHFAPSTDLTVPAALSSVVLSIDNLTDFRLHSHLKVHSGNQPLYTVQGNQAYFLTPSDVKTIYDVNPAYTQGYNGAGQTIAVVGQSAVVTTDITTFQTLLGLTAKAPGINLVPETGTSTVVNGDETESDLDLEYSSAMAPGATVNFYYTGNAANTGGVIDALEYVVDYDKAPIVSISYGDCELDDGVSGIQSFDSTVLIEAAVQGQTIVASAGDDGSTDCAEDTNLSFAQQTSLAVDYPASSQYVTGMGGTEFPVADVTPTNTTYWTSAGNSSDLVSSATQYIPEQVWNDDVADLTYAEEHDVSPLSSGGGGISLYEPRPAWQTGVPGIPTTGTAGTQRLVPDISLAASADYPGYLFCSSDKDAWGTDQTGSCGTAFYEEVGDSLYYTVAGGTSFDAPIFAGLVAVINQAKGYTSGQGVINKELYTLASNPTTYASAFHDITSGGNQCAAGTTYCGTGNQTTEFAAGVGYDEASGLGSIDFSNLLTAWPASTAVGTTTVSTTTLTPATSTPASGVSDVIAIKVASASGLVTTTPTGTVSVSVDGSVVDASLPLTNGVASYTFSSTTDGTHTIEATYSGDATYAASVGSVSVNVGNVSFSLSASNITLTAGSSGSVTVTATPVNGYTGTIDLNSVTVTTTATTAAGDTFCGTYPSSLTISSTAAATAVFSVYTSASSCTAQGLVRGGMLARGRSIASSAPHRSPWHRAPVPVAFAGLMLAMVFTRRSRKLRGLLSLTLLALLGLGAAGLTGCSNSSANTPGEGSSGNAPAGVYTFSVTGQDSVNPALTATTSFTITIQ